uniref:Uncharacterized protein LOC108950821 n=1 Tax=Phallusia mammillata TaxID=59560 RepID=A0A6F9DIU3_9ASCI|nr:uncharacterized protein LOC108950821 [Phallusia mammillata]
MLSYKQAGGYSRPCGKCALCGGRKGFKAMVASASCITTPSNHSIPLRQQLTCKNYGIYVATCTTCKEQYVGQTKNHFSTRWNSHRSTWRTGDLTDAKGDKMALAKHYIINHPYPEKNKPDISSCFMVTFVEEPPMSRLDICEDKWLNDLRASINPRFFRERNEMLFSL